MVLFFPENFAFLVVDGSCSHFFSHHPQHARRLYPLQLCSKKPIEWGYFDEKDEEWKVVDKAILNDNMVENLEKSIGFEGRPDPASGFYCVYDAGRLKLGDESSFK
jgi:hypothetical protein